MDAVLLGCAAGVGVGALSASIRRGLGFANDVEAGSLVMTAVALLAAVCIAFGIRAGFDDLRPAQLWPFLVIGLVVPGATRTLYLRAIRDAGPSRTGIVLGVTPLVAALLGIGLLGEPFRAGLAAGTVLIVAGAVALAWERTRPPGFRLIGIALAFTVAILVGVRDVTVRWATEEASAPPIIELATVLAAATMVLLAYLVVHHRGRGFGIRIRRAAVPFVPIGLLATFASLAVIEALDRGPVTVVSPLVATSAIWAVVFAALTVRHGDAIGKRLIFAAVLVVRRRSAHRRDAVGVRAARRQCAAACIRRATVRYSDLGTTMSRTGKDFLRIPVWSVKPRFDKDDPTFPRSLPNPATYLLQALCYDSLAAPTPRPDRDGISSPNFEQMDVRMAEEFGQSGETTWWVRLKPGVRSHWGNELTAASVKWGFDRAFALGNVAAWRWGQVAGIPGADAVEVLDDYTVGYTLRAPNPNFPAFLFFRNAGRRGRRGGAPARDERGSVVEGVALEQRGRDSARTRSSSARTTAC